MVDTASYRVIANVSVEQPGYYGGLSGIYFNSQGSEAFFIYSGARPIDSPVPDIPSIIGVMDPSSFDFIYIINLDEHAGAGAMAIRR